MSEPAKRGHIIPANAVVLAAIIVVSAAASGAWTATKFRGMYARLADIELESRYRHQSLARALAETQNALSGYDAMVSAHRPSPGLPPGRSEPAPAQLHAGRAEFVLPNSARNVFWERLAVKNEGPAKGSFRLEINGGAFPWDLARASRKFQEISGPAARSAALLAWYAANTWHATPPTGDDRLDHDPAVFFNAFRYGFCDDHAHAFAHFAAAAGLRARVVAHEGHVTAELELPGDSGPQWSYFDPDYKVYFPGAAGKPATGGQACGAPQIFDTAFARPLDRHFGARLPLLRDIVCAPPDAHRVVADYPAGSGGETPLTLEIWPSDTWEFAPHEPIARLATARPPYSQLPEPPVGHVRVAWAPSEWDVPVTIAPGQERTFVIRRAFPLPVIGLFAALRLRHAGARVIWALSDDSHELSSTASSLEPGQHEPSWPLIRPSGSPATLISRGIGITLTIKNTGSTAAKVEAPRFTSLLQMAPGAMPRPRPGTNAVAVVAESGTAADVKLTGLMLRFGDVPDLTPPAQPLEPQDGATLTVQSVRLHWPAPLDPAVRHRIELSARDDLLVPATPALFHDVETNELELGGPTLPVLTRGVRYYWRVRRIDTYGREGDPSPIWTFQVRP